MSFFTSFSCEVTRDIEAQRRFGLLTNRHKVTAIASFNWTAAVDNARHITGHLFLNKNRNAASKNEQNK